MCDLTLNCSDSDCACGRGGNVSPVRDDGVLVGDSDAQAGGAKKPSVADFFLTVEQESNVIWFDDDLTLVQEENDDYFVVDNV